MRLRRRHRAPGPPADRLLRRPDPLPTAPPPVLLLVRSEAVARGGVLGRVDQRDPLHAGHRRRAAVVSILYDAGMFGPLEQTFIIVNVENPNKVCFRICI